MGMGEGTLAWGSKKVPGALFAPRSCVPCPRLSGPFKINGTCGAVHWCIHLTHAY